MYGFTVPPPGGSELNERVGRYHILSKRQVAEGFSFCLSFFESKRTKRTFFFMFFSLFHLKVDSASFTSRKQVLEVFHTPTSSKR